MRCDHATLNGVDISPSRHLNSCHGASLALLAAHVLSYPAWIDGNISYGKHGMDIAYVLDGIGCDMYDVI